MNKFTLMIHNKGWTVTAACEYWGIHYDTYNKRCNSDKMHNQLDGMCQGLEQKRGQPLIDKMAKLIDSLPVVENPHIKLFTVAGILDGSDFKVTDAKFGYKMKNKMPEFNFKPIEDESE